MPPDLNSLPASPSPSSPLQHATSHRPSTTMTHSLSPSASPSHSLTAAATMNAGIHSEDLRRQSSGSMRREVERARRRSSIRMNLNLNDPGLPAPGELASPSSRSRSGQWPHSPHHERAPSLGELHQELEYEQEGQVNRLLNMIRQQQSQLQQLQITHPQPSTSAVEDDATTPTSERSMSLAHGSSIPPPPHPQHAAIPGSHSPFTHNNSRTTLSRHSSMAGAHSTTNSNTASPALRPSSGTYDTPHEYLPSPAVHSRDESVFYQAETQMLTRENQMLKLRIRELERQLSDRNPASPSLPLHSPSTESNLHSSMPADGEGAESAGASSAASAAAGETRD